MPAKLTLLVALCSRRVNNLILKRQRFTGEWTALRPEPTEVVLNLDADNLCFYLDWLALLKDDMENALSGFKISKHDSLVINGVAHVGLLCMWLGSMRDTETSPFL